MASKEIAREIPTIIRIYKDGSVERLMGSPHVPPSLSDPETGVSSKDITISQNPPITARLYLPSSQQPPAAGKLPVLVYFHGGAFLVESAFSFLHHRCLNRLVSELNAVAVSVEYRSAPEHPLPAAYDDSWAALQWVAHELFDESPDTEPWLKNHGDPSRVYLGGDSAGGNIVHNVALRAGGEDLPGGLKLVGAFLSHPYFWGGSDEGEKGIMDEIWDVAYPDAPGGIDNPMINPMAPGAPSLAGIGCRKMLVIVSEKDVLRDWGVKYGEKVKESGWKGEVDIFEVKGEDHCFHFFDLDKENSKRLIRKIAAFFT